MAKRNLFNSVKMTKPNRNVFDLTHDVKLTCNMGELVPVCLMECVPGDKFELGCTALVRFAPMVFPVMHRIDVTVHYFFVPNRIMWQHWEEWITRDPQSTAGNDFPFVVVNAVDNGINGVGTVGDYLGVPTPSLNSWASTSETVSALPWCAYQMCWNEYYRDQNLQTALYEPQGFLLTDGDNTANGDLFAFRYRAWEHDYFTSALPFAQKGAAVTLPIAGFADVPVHINQAGPPASAAFNSDTPLGVSAVYDLVPSANISIAANEAYAATSLLDAQAATINDLRRAFRLQEYLEKNARGGTRYFEHILMHFGVRSPDSRLNRPEYITGVKTPVMISEVLNTAGTFTDPGGDPTSRPQGDMAGHGVSVTTGGYGKYFVQEHGYIIGIMSVMPKTAYSQGFERHWKKIVDPTQYFYPSFAHIGEQAVFNHEIAAYLTPGSTVADQDGTFGYEPRYAEYKFINNRIAGQFRSTLNSWHLGRQFGSQPLLNSDFIMPLVEDTTRIFAVTDPDEDHLFCHVLNRVKAIRPMPKFGNPSF